MPTIGPLVFRACKLTVTLALFVLQRQQVELAHILAERYPELGSYSTHPGWADTAGMLCQ